MSHEPTASEPPLPPTPVDPLQSAATDYVIPYMAVMDQKRLHPATIIVQVVKFARGMVVFLGFLLFMRFSGKRADSFELVAALMGAFGILGGVIKYVSFRYSVRDGALFIRSGILQKQDRTIPLERIQNINLKQDLVHRLLGVADVRIETASGGDAEAVLSVLSMADAIAIREALTARVHGAETSVGAPVVEVETIYHASLRHLLLAGATQNRLGTILAAVAGFVFYLNSMTGREPGAITRIVTRMSKHTAMPGWTSILLVGVGLVAIGWIASMLMTVVSRFGFRLTRSQSQLHRTFGLLTKHESIFPVQRVQVLKITSPLLQRCFGLCRISAETAGSFREEKKEESGTNELCPIIERRRAGEMSRLVLADFYLDDVKLVSIHRLGQRRAFVRALVVLTLMTVGAAWFGSSTFWFAMIGVPVVSWVYAAVYFRSIKYCLDGEYFTLQRGMWTRTLEVVPLTKIQASFVTQSPLQRRLGLASFEVLTAGTSFAKTVAVRDVGLQIAIDLQEKAVLASESLREIHTETRDVTASEF